MLLPAQCESGGTAETRLYGYGYLVVTTAPLDDSLDPHSALSGSDTHLQLPAPTRLLLTPAHHLLSSQVLMVQAQVQRVAAVTFVVTDTSDVTTRTAVS